MILTVDNYILDFIQNNFKCGFLDWLMPKVSFLGNGGLLWIALTIIFLCIKKYRKIGITMALGLLMSLIIGNLILKPIIARPRPFTVNTDIELLILRPLDYSFPSGHTLASFISAVIIFKFNKKLGTAALILAVLIAFSRMYLYVHYPTDILGGIVIGTIIALSSYLIVMKYFNREKK